MNLSKNNWLRNIRIYACFVMDIKRFIYKGKLWSLSWSRIRQYEWSYE